MVPVLPMPTFMSLVDDKALSSDEVVEAAVAKAIKVEPKKTQFAPVVSSLKPLGETSKGKNDLPKDATLTKYVEAVKASNKAKLEMQTAQGKLMVAMEGLLEVPSADTLTLRKIANGALGQDSLITFYAPWCPHCQTFVLHDTKSNPSNAPYEVLFRDLAKDDASKSVAVFRADITKIGDNIPDAFQVQGIPTVYGVTKLGDPQKFTGNAHSQKELKEFVKKLVR